MQCNSVVDTVLRHRQNLERSRGSLFWCFCNGWGLVIVLNDIFSRWMSSAKIPLVWYLECIVALGLILNMCVHLWSYFCVGGGAVASSPRGATPLTPTQCRLLALDPDDPAFSTAETPLRSPSQPQVLNISDMLLSPSSPSHSSPSSTPPSASSPITPLNHSARSWLSSDASSPGTLYGSSRVDSSLNASLSSSSWLYYKTTSPTLQTPQRSTVMEPSVRRRRCQTAPPHSFQLLQQEQLSLSKLLKEVDQVEKKLLEEDSVGRPQAHGTIRSFTTVSGSTLGDTMASVGGQVGRRQVYMLSVPSPGQTVGLAGRPADNAVVSTNQGSDRDEVWTRLGIPPHVLVQWTQNLRTWLSQTILLRLMSEVDSVNSHLERLSMSDTQVGRSPLDKLKQVASSPQLPSVLSMALPQLLPFLEAAPLHQEYLLGRLRELARGGCMAAYVWNKGGAFRGRPWTQDLPSDAALVMHLLVTYLDACLPSPPSPCQPDSRPFSSQYFLRQPWSPSDTSRSRDSSTFQPQLAIYQAQTSPPLFKLVVGADIIEVPKGANNLFHTVLLFLNYLKTKQKGMLGRMNLGPSGINILAVMQDGA